MKNQLIAARSHLMANDNRLEPIISKAGLCTIRPHTKYYQELVDAIISQQLSIKAAATIESRFCAIYGARYPSPEEIIKTPEVRLRQAGLSRAKISYITDLAQSIVSGQLNMDNLNALSNSEVIDRLTSVKGIGEWTAHMFLMFAMGRLDVLAHGDLGIRNGIMEIYGLKQLPSPVEVSDIAAKNKWHPYETVACWYIWHYKDS